MQGAEEFKGHRMVALKSVVISVTDPLVALICLCDNHDYTNADDRHCT